MTTEPTLATGIEDDVEPPEPIRADIYLMPAMGEPLELLCTNSLDGPRHTIVITPAGTALCSIDGTAWFSHVYALSRDRLVAALLDNHNVDNERVQAALRSVLGMDDK